MGVFHPGQERTPGGGGCTRRSRVSVAEGSREGADVGVTLRGQ